jgi:hypothetical protein
MIANNYLQADLIAALKADTALVAELGDDARIKEQQWAGTGFDYPAIRLRLARQVPEGRSNCDHNILSFSVLVFAEGGSGEKLWQAVANFSGTVRRA